MSVEMDVLGYVGSRQGIETGVMVRRWDLEDIGDTIKGHRHGVSHATLIARGRVRLETSEETREVPALSWVPVRAADLHTLTALEPETVVFCVFAGPAGDLA